MIEKSAKKPIDTVNKVKSNLKKYREQFEKLWREEDEAYHGKIWKNTSGYRPYENFVFKTIETEVPILTDSYPSSTAKMLDDGFEEQAKILSKSIEWVQKDQNLSLQLPMVVRNSLISAPGYIHAYYDANDCNGQGRIIHEILPWKQVYLHGGSLFVESCESARIELYRSRTWLLRNYPKFKDEIKKAKSEDVIDDDYREGRETQDTGNQYAKRVPPKPYCDDDTLKLVKTFIRDYSMEAIPDEVTAEELQSEAQGLETGEGMDVARYQDHNAHLEAHMAKLAELYGYFGLTPDVGFDAVMQVAEQIAQGNEAENVEMITLQIKILESHIEEHKVLLEENPKGQRLKYPDGLRCIESLGSTILYDGKSRDEHNQIPVVPFYCYRNGTIYGDGEVRNLLDSQRMQAVMGYKVYKGLQRVANPEKEILKSSGLTADDITNEDGAVYEVDEPNSIRDIPPGQISEQVVRFAESKREVMQDLSGMNEATQGAMPSPNASGVTVERIQQQALGRIRLKDRQNQSYSIKRLGMLDASLIIQYWTDEKLIKLDNQGESAEAYIFNPLEMQDLKYEIEIEQGSMAGVDKEAFNMMAVNFLNNGHINFQEFLTIAEIPRKQKLLSMVSERFDLESQMQEMQQQMIMLKGQYAPQTLASEEMQVFQELQAQQMGVNQDQPIA